MYQQKVYGNLVFSLFTEEITLDDVQAFADGIDGLLEAQNEMFLIALPINVDKYPQNITTMLKASKKLKNATSTLTRFYTIELTSILTFVSNIVTQMVGIKGKIVMKKSVDDLLATIEKDAQQFPGLKSSLPYLKTIKDEVDALQANV